ncbi:glycosyl hydrolase family 28-related protein [Pseudosulfitobacter koreensis]|uniref:Rhamnogalacturonase A/B/Epimerase-like pectate lyase domain-containing protein n=1 Tax=Pseudosulfitobacter koreensis TaxID=2968472 RepID=A0ABT1Z3D8_9RHOB|nr:glycosyl hydrolase family 28-related protein [Pseudosulfitobacter koreense]MCR8827664.1 hypothetical protein [Pseudosulfitobacter koreense]
MNKAITDGVLLMPPPFANGLGVYSSGDGTPGSDTYANAANAAFVPADQDFAGCLEIQKNASTTKLRYMGETPMLPGCYLRVTARIKAISGNLPSVRIAGFAAAAGGANVAGVVQTGDAVPLTSYGQIVEVSAIIGTGDRGGVDMVWGRQALYGHFGLDLTGPNGGVVRVDDIVIEDVTQVFLRDMLAQVDVRDYGAIGDGTTDDSAAFDAANAAAAGRHVLIPAGVYRLNSDMTFDTHVRFEGTLSMPTEAVLLLRRDFHLPAYIDAFENEELAFTKAFQALLNNADHESLDMGGRKVNVTGPIDMIAAVPSKTSYATRRIIRNGQFEASGTAAWATQTTTSQATYDPDNATRLDNVVNVANIEVGSVVTGNGVGREVYVRSKNVAQQRITLSAPLYDAAGTQTFTFRRFRYLLDFSGFSSLSKFGLDGIEFQCNNVCSGILLAESGLTFTVQDCFISRPKDRGISSHGGGCQGMIIDRCQFLSSEDGADMSDRVSIGFNVNANDVKIRNNRATKFRHWAVIGGGSSIIIGNHFFQGDTVNGGVRSAGLVMAKPHSSGVISANYIDNCFIEWTNEHDQAPEFNSEFSFSALSITGNTFLSGGVAPWFSYIVVKPHGAGHFLSGVSITGNKFRSISGNIDRVERVDTSFADLDRGRFKDIEFHGNSFHGINTSVANPLRLRHGEASPSQTWVIDTDGQLPFGGRAVQVASVTAHGPLRNGNNVIQYETPYTDPEEGPDRDQVHLHWGQAVKGTVNLTVRLDN